MPFFMPMLAIILLQSLSPFTLDEFIQRLLLRLSAMLPSNLALVIPILIAFLALLYWTVESVFNQVEFPDKSKETA